MPSRSRSEPNDSASTLQSITWQRAIGRCLVVLLLATAIACAGGQAPTSPSGTGTVPTLVEPHSNAYVRQNDPATGCRQDPVWGYGYHVTFKWNAVRGATSYRLHLMHPMAYVPLIDEPVTGTSYELRRCTEILGIAQGWEWKVRARLAGGQESEWSEVRVLNFTAPPVIE